MKSSDEKDLIMSRLSNLKNAEEKCRRISVKDDYTLKERNLVKHWLKIADEKNKAEGTTKYKIRDTPKKRFSRGRDHERTTTQLNIKNISYTQSHTETHGRNFYNWKFGTISIRTGKENLYDSYRS